MPAAKKHVCITGCSRGLGRALVLGFAARGWVVSGCARSQDALGSLKAVIGEGAVLDRCDVSDDQDVAKFVSKVVDHSGAPDLVVNNAAIINPSAPLWEVSAEQFSDVIDINIKGVASVLRHFIPPMIERGSGILINLSSGWGRGTAPEVAPYCATKYAVEGLTSALAQELPSGLATAAMNPGIINTEMLQSCWAEGASGYEDATSWASRAVPFLVGLDQSCNGQQLTAP